MKNEIINNFRRNNTFLRYILNGLTEDDMLLSTGKSNNLGWIVGHLTLGRGKLLNILNKICDVNETEKKFERGVKKKKDIGINMMEVLKRYETRGDSIVDTLNEIADSDFQNSESYNLSDKNDNLGSYLSFFAFHESFHLGQIDLIKTANGKEGIK